LGKSCATAIFSDAHWREPLKWDREAAKAGERRRVFCASMADVFEDRADLNEARERLWGLIEATPNLDWLLLTKRIRHVRKLAPGAANGLKTFG
jgi:protein gp37